MAEIEVSAAPPARNVLYCGICSLPPEYCEFGGTAKKCEQWLQENHPDVHKQLYSEEVISANLNALSLEARERAAKDSAKKEAKAALDETRDQERKAVSKIQIHRVERNKRKFVTVISGLEAFGLDNKKIAKELGKKFATGSSVTKSATSSEEITVQGDVNHDVEEWLCDTYGDTIPEDNITLTEQKPKKKAGV